MSVLVFIYANAIIVGDNITNVNPVRNEVKK